MGLYEKVAWFNLVVLAIGTTFYIIILKSVIAALNFHISFIFFISASILMILCNFGWIIYYENKNNFETNIDNQNTRGRRKTRLDLHLLYWGAFISILIGAWFWLSFEANNVISHNFYYFILFIALGLSFLYTTILHMYKKRKGESVETSPIVVQKVYPAHDERDLMIRKSSRKHALMALFAVLFIGFLAAITWVKFHPSTFFFSINTAYILLIFQAIILFRHIVIQFSTIIQYRLGK